MKSTVFFIVFVLLMTSCLQAQSDKKKQTDPTKGIMDMVGSQVGMNSVMSGLVKGLKTSSFTGGKSGKKDLLSQLSGIGSSDYLQYASFAGELAGSLKGSAFLPDWANKKDGVLDQIQSAASIADVASGVSSMFSMLNPSALSGSFKKKQSSWTTALNALSLLK